MGFLRPGFFCLRLGLFLVELYLRLWFCMTSSLPSSQLSNSKASESAKFPWIVATSAAAVSTLSLGYLLYRKKKLKQECQRKNSEDERAKSGHDHTVSSSLKINQVEEMKRLMLTAAKDPPSKLDPNPALHMLHPSQPHVSKIHRTAKDGQLPYRHNSSRADLNWAKHLLHSSGTQSTQQSFRTNEPEAQTRVGRDHLYCPQIDANTDAASSQIDASWTSNETPKSTVSKVFVETSKFSEESDAQQFREITEISEPVVALNVTQNCMNHVQTVNPEEVQNSLHHDTVNSFSQLSLSSNNTPSSPCFLPHSSSGFEKKAPGCLSSAQSYDLTSPFMPAFAIDSKSTVKVEEEVISNNLLPCSASIRQYSSNKSIETSLPAHPTTTTSTPQSVEQSSKMAVPAILGYHLMSPFIFLSPTSSTPTHNTSILATPSPAATTTITATTATATSSMK